MGNFMLIYCCKCRKNVQAALTSGKEIYPHRPDLYDKQFYKCPHCGEYVGCHKGTTRPLGCIPSAELKVARIKLHNEIDPLWKSGKITRTGLYKNISVRLGYQYHTGQTKTVSECMKVLDIVLKIKEELQ